MKFCVHCAHYVPPSERYWKATCARFAEPRFDPVSGKQIGPRRDDCDMQRQGGWIGCRASGTCGVEGRFFVAKAP